MRKSKVFLIDSAWRILLKDVGIPVADLMRRAGLPEDLLSRPQEGLSSTDYFRFWNALEKIDADPLLPLRLVEALTAEVFSASLFAALCSKNLQQAVHRIAHYKQLIAPMALDIAVDAQANLRLTPRWLENAHAIPHSLMLAELAFFVRLARMATREPVPASSVQLPQLPEPLAAYEAYYGAKITLGPPSIAFALAHAQKPFLTANERMWDMFEPELQKRLATLQDNADTSQRVHAVLLESLPSGQASIDHTAQRLAMSKRTLQRRLGEEGLSFQLLVKRTRESLARHYLSKTHLSNGEIAFLLGFEEPNSFFRAIHDWTGQTPERLRRNTAAH
jgi:AraC-like DNA-binding protein